MNLQQIKESVKNGIPVYWVAVYYKVLVDKKGQWLIKCTLNGSCIGLTWADGVTLNGKKSEFFTLKK